jgi:hypothetical protein
MSQATEIEIAAIGLTADEMIEVVRETEEKGNASQMNPHEDKPDRSDPKPTPPEPPSHPSGPPIRPQGDIDNPGKNPPPPPPPGGGD